MTPFLALVLAAYAVFIFVLGAYGTQSFIDSVRSARAPERGG